MVLSVRLCRTHRGLRLDSGFWLIPAVAAVILLGVIARSFRLPGGELVFATYRDGIELGGTVRRGRVTYRIIQWVPDPADSGPCPLVLHLPGGDLRGDELRDRQSPAFARLTGGPAGLEVFPFHAGGKIIGFRVGVLPGERPVEMSVSGKRFALPLSGEEAIRLLGEPTGRVGSAPQKHSTGNA